MRKYLERENIILPFRFITGTDFVSSLGQPAEYPGLKEKPNGCMKDKAGHARQVRHDSYRRCSRHRLPLQVTDTSAINMFLNDEAFANIVLGGNYFKILRYENCYSVPESVQSISSPQA